MSELPFWERKTLSKMTRIEWESLSGAGFPGRGY